MLRYIGIVVVLSVTVLKSSVGYSLYPGIFDPNPFIPKMNPQVLKVTSSALKGPVYGHDTSDGAKDDEVGYVKSDRVKGQGGFHHVETFHTKDGDDYEHEYESGNGESKDDADHGIQQESSYRKRDNENDLKNHDTNYEVIEEQSNDHKNPNHQATYGVKPIQPTKRPATPEFGSKLALPKKTMLKHNHNGYETVVYHGQEQESSEKGYGRRNHQNGLPKEETIEQKIDDSDEEQEQEEGEEERDEDDEKDNQKHESDRNSGQTKFGHNYNGFKYDADFGDFSKNFNDDAKRDQSGDQNSWKDSRSGVRQNRDDYDDEVDQDEHDEEADEDRYQGGEYDEDDDESGQKQRPYGNSNDAEYDN
ncbi:YTH domain-containing protein 1-like [Armigeres subalbatus]|uniref:YTH domain-containing protein 1-like n=1 Tax=Armigeres subalbatus TaxID=124917 RepID=UPI002ED5D385